MKESNTSTTTKAHSDALMTYESSLESQRLRFEDHIFPILAEEDPKTLLLFWINFSSYGVPMTEPVEDWIRKAGERCKELNFLQLGENLRKHAIHEADHHLLMIEDTKKLINRWNQLYTPTLDADLIFKRPPLESVIHYQKLHTDYIYGNAPYCQIAIEYEIENLSVAHGKQIIDHTVKVLGKEILSDLSFLVDHVEIDVAHTKFNRKALSGFLNEQPQILPQLVDAGIKALITYGNFLSECLKRSRV